MRKYNITLTSVMFFYSSPTTRNIPQVQASKAQVLLHSEDECDIYQFLVLFGDQSQFALLTKFLLHYRLPGFIGPLGHYNPSTMLLSLYTS